MSKKIKELNKELNDLLINFNENNRELIKTKISEFEKDCLNLTKKILPNFKIPIYINIHDIDNNKLNSKTSWFEWENKKNKFVNLNDNYCRDIYGNGNYVYPVRNPRTGVVYFRNCNTYIDNEMIEITDLKNELSVLIAQARNSILNANLSSNSGKDKIQKEINNKLEKYESLQEKYIQITKMIDNFNILLKDKRKILNDKTDDYNKLDNNLNIKRDNENTFNNEFKYIKIRNTTLLYYAKIMFFICWLIILILFAFININKVLT